MRNIRLLALFILVVVGCSSNGGSIPSESTDGGLVFQTEDLQLLFERCGQEDMTACDELAASSPAESDFAEFGATCGERLVQSLGSCVDVFDSGGREAVYEAGLAQIAESVKGALDVVVDAHQEWETQQDSLGDEDRASLYVATESALEAGVNVLTSESRALEQLDPPDPAEGRPWRLIANNR